MHTTCPLSGGKVKFEVFDSWNHIWSWFQAWSWTRTCWWENNWDPQVQQWGLSFLYMYMVSSKLPWPKNTQDLKGVRFIPLFSLYSRVYPAFLMFNSISHKDSWVFSLISWKHVAFTTVFLSPGSRLRKSGALTAVKTLCWGYQRTPGTTLNKAQSPSPPSSPWCMGQEISLKP